MGKPLKGILAAVVSLTLTLLLLEGLAFVAAGFRQTGDSIYYDKPCAKFNPIYGYRYTPGTCRVARIVGGRISYDETFDINSRGFVAPQEYTPAKQSPERYRYVAFGDSFTEASFLPRNWPQQLQTLWNENGVRDSEIYSFAVDGGGLANWHRIFFLDVVPNYDFDALIIASFVDNLKREFSILHMDDERAYFKRFPRPFDSRQTFLARGLPRMEATYEIVGETRFDELIDAAQRGGEWHRPPLRLHGLDWLLERRSNRNQAQRVAEEMAHANRAVESLPEGAGRDVVLTHLTRRYGPGAARQLAQVLDHCNQHGKPVILAAVPHKETLLAGLQHGDRARENFHQRELRLVAAAFGIEYFDGYAAFSDVTPRRINDELWLQNDGHWNENGSDRFAAALHDFLRDRSR
ncbi:MAG: hypothetical protein GY716_22470 [bacterium]|nr:hypothetical protein [bacterium]